MKRSDQELSVSVPWEGDPNEIAEVGLPREALPDGQPAQFDYWRLCDELTIVQAALLFAGRDPSAIATYVEGWSPESRPRAYEPAKQAIGRALARGIIRGEVVHEFDPIDQWNSEETDRLDVARSFVQVESLKGWLTSRGISSGFFFPEPVKRPDYLDPQHSRYAPKLAAAVAAWRALEDPAALKGKSAKQALQKWIREHASEFALTDEDGKPFEQGVEDVAKVANWQLTGGAPRTPGS